MKYLVLILLAASISVQAKTTNDCGPDSVICRYEQLYTKYSLLSKFASSNKSIIWALLYENTSGKLFNQLSKYIESTGTPSFDGSLVFLDPANVVISTTVLSNNPSKKIIKRVVRENRTITVEGVETVSELTLIYTLSKDGSFWKVSDLTYGTR